MGSHLATSGMVGGDTAGHSPPCQVITLGTEPVFLKETGWTYNHLESKLLHFRDFPGFSKGGGAKDEESKGLGQLGF